MGKNQSTPQRVPQEDIDEINQLASKSPEDMHKYLENKCNGWQSVTVTIGILGESHRGKSSFINAARKLKPGDPEAPQVKNRECTMEQTSYGYPDNPKITLVDLPGVGTNRFQRDKYIEKIDFTRYLDYFDATLCVRISVYGSSRFCVVSSKINHRPYNEKVYEHGVCRSPINPNLEINKSY